MTSPIEPKENEMNTESLIAAFKAIDKLTCSCPCMSREVQAHFERNPEPDAYRVELNTLILAIRQQAREALKTAIQP